jgi:outer membrane protein TolC
MIEQRFPLSGVLGHRRRVAEADARRLHADTKRVAQDVQLDAANAFLMLRERRELARIIAAQTMLARQFVSAASARYASGTGSQPEVLRAEVEVARLEGAIRVLAEEVAAGETMLNASLGRPVDAPLPALAGPPLEREPGTWPEIRGATLRHRPELEMGRAEIGRAGAEIAAMDAMYFPMAFVRTGPSYTMTDRWGWMLTLGVSVPIFREKFDAGVREARAMEAMARADLSAMARMFEGEAATARYQVLAARQRVLSLRDDVLPRARQSIDPSVAAYAAGTMPLVSVLDAAQTLWSLEAELVAAELELGLAWARLGRAQGQLETGPRR